MKAEWKKESKEHDWLTKAEAKRIARDHAAQKRIRPRKGHGTGAIATASKDVGLLCGGMKRITYGPHKPGGS